MSVTSFRRPLAIALWMAAAALAACDTDGNGTVNECPAVVKLNPDMGIHGELCETNADCEYGQCVASPAVTGSVKFCTKKCRCGTGSSCSDDPGISANLEPTCIRMPTTAPGEPLTGAFCLQICQTVSDCKLLDEAYNRCALVESVHGSVGTKKVCQIDPAL